ncbi:YqiA/YcfP family alpha/beta fold hydrolase [Paraglaciecola sp. L3A3]|uniref:YqiA/YcfP family alpha/beta fold hydrolase n=1 Tax=Paraglaciecola sp. L3A3 TaxID=2686358 RepID=UPI00131C42BB|nr:YqiA/YcfP family alpha/beta fold hydrolase [Paraglaciecola sp. L3A3]
MKVYFSHGKESGPWGSKITRLANVAKAQGYSVDSIDYSDILDPDLRVERLISVLENAEDEFLLVGSSMGGYVSLVASEQVIAKGVFLLAPALFMQGYKKQSYSNETNVEIVHGWSDDIIPVENSIKQAKIIDCSLHLISGDHRLNSSIKTVEQLFLKFLKSHNKIL